MPRGSNYQKLYPPEFRREAVELYRRSGRSLKEKEPRPNLGALTRRIHLFVALPGAATRSFHPSPTGPSLPPRRSSSGSTSPPG
jgi:hypothetical protein